MVNILYFASLREQVGLAHESIALPAVATVAGLIEMLRARGGEWPDALAANKPWRVAVNQEIAAFDTPLKSDDEVAIFPPVTGG